jgi:hypothetical protein
MSIIRSVLALTFPEQHQTIEGRQCMDPYITSRSLGELRASRQIPPGRLPFSIEKGAFSFSSILNLNNNHWVAFSIFPFDYIIWVWNSLDVEADLPELVTLAKCLCQAPKLPQDNIQPWKFTRLKSTLQSNPADCGVIATQNLVDYIRRGTTWQGMDDTLFSRQGIIRRLV